MIPTIDAQTRYELEQELARQRYINASFDRFQAEEREKEAYIEMTYLT